MKNTSTRKPLLLHVTERRTIELSLIDAHPQNREFETRGAEWDEFEDDIAERGIRVPLVVREMEDGGLQCLEGHRRLYAGKKRKVEFAECDVVRCSDEEAFLALWEGNLFRVNPNPCDEARVVDGMADLFGHTVEEIALVLNHSVEWVRTRQGLLKLGDEVMEAVRRPGNDRLTIGAVEEILKVPEKWWPDAVQLVLLPDLEMLPLSAEQARYELKKRLIDPKAKAEAWEKSKEKLQKAWYKALAKLCRAGTKDELAVQVRTLEDAERVGARGMEQAEDLLPLADLLPSAPDGVRWVHLAVKHGLAVQVVPGDGKPSADDKAMASRAVVDAVIIRQAEAAAAEHGVEPWLVTSSRKTVAVPLTDDEKRVQRAKAVADGEGDPLYQEDPNAEKVETVIEQKMEHHAMIDMGAVKRVAMWAISTDADPMNAPDFVPKWACKLGMEGMWAEIDQITEWVVKLKGSAE